MQLHINGIAKFDPFGVPWLKHDSVVSQILDLSQPQKSFSLMNGEVTAGVALSDGTSGPQAEIKVAVFGMPIFDKTLPLDGHVGNGPVSLAVGGPQLGFYGTVQVTP